MICPRPGATLYDNGDDIHRNLEVPRGDLRRWMKKGSIWQSVDIDFAGTVSPRTPVAAEPIADATQHGSPVLPAISVPAVTDPYPNMSWMR